jgi:hypothetical protein
MAVTAYLPLVESLMVGIPLGGVNYPGTTGKKHSYSLEN